MPTWTLEADYDAVHRSMIEPLGPEAADELRRRSDAATLDFVIGPHKPNQTPLPADVLAKHQGRARLDREKAGYEQIGDTNHPRWEGSD